MKILGLIPARRGSRRLPNKNLASLFGEPLIAHTCRAALQSSALDKVYVNTDCPEIAEVASQFGVRCPRLRPPDLATSNTPTRISNQWLMNQLSEEFDAIAVLQPTSPLRSAEDINAAVTIFESNSPCSVVSIAPVAPANWLGDIARDGQFRPHVGSEMNYRLNGAIYLYTWEDYLFDRPPRREMAYSMPRERSMDIDTAFDLHLVEAMMSTQSPVTA